jgi:polar amino acid transport system substrate-binding protein
VVVLASEVGTFEATEEEFLRKVLTLALDLIPKAKYGSISLLKKDAWYFVVSVGHDEEKLKSLKLKKNYAFVDLTRVVMVDDIMGENRHRIPEGILKEFIRATLPVKSSVLAPIGIKGKLVGFFAIDIPKKSEEEFDEEDLELIDIFSRVISGFYAARKYFEVLGKFHERIVKAFVRSLEHHSKYTKGHLERVAFYSSQLAERMGIPKDAIRKIYWAGMIHDIGKIAISQNILMKPDKLTDEEYDLVKKHSIVGYEILMELEEMEDIAQIVRWHHERCDGAGYPDGLTCKKIPLGAKIISVSDAFDAMASERPYRKKRSIYRALEEIKENSGTQFDPEVAREFIKILKEGKLDVHSTP